MGASAGKTWRAQAGIEKPARSAARKSAISAASVKGWRLCPTCPATRWLRDEHDSG
jgi:hypothetical protein